ncbi:hypothetical protein BGW42_004257 [Actinomortierella wolfii]|nr:hypothetical protein BGW42_004257 [Actinomortierella wolfii]
MALPINFAILDNINDPKLNKSADALEHALAHFGKFNSSANVGNESLALPTNNADGNGFDEWLAADLQFGSLAGDDLASPLGSSPLSALEESPVLGFDSFGNSELEGSSSPLFDMSELLNAPAAASPSDAAAAAAAAFIPVTSAVPSPMSSAPATPRLSVAAPAAVPAGPKVGLPVLTTDAVKQAAAALNIPWSDELEKAVLAQAMLPIGSTIPVAANNNNNNNSAMPSLPAPSSIPMPVAPSPLATAAAAAPGPKMVKTNKRGIIVEEPEEVVAKRAKNTDAARRSRLKKLMKLESLEKKVAELETINKGLSLRVAVLESEKNAHLVKDAEQNARIAQLEAKLAEAHLALSQSRMANKLKSEEKEEK